MVSDRVLVVRRVDTLASGSLPWLGMGQSVRLVGHGIICRVRSGSGHAGCFDCCCLHAAGSHQLLQRKRLGVRSLPRLPGSSTATPSMVPPIKKPVAWTGRVMGKAEFSSV